MTSVEILFCRENLARFGQEAWQRLSAEQRPELRIQVVKCIIACSDCATAQIARVNGQLVTADSADQLLLQINELVEQAKQ